MNLFKKIQLVFLPVSGSDIKNEDKFSSFEIGYSISNFLEFDFENLADFISLIPEHETWTLNVKIGNSDSIKLVENNLDEFKSLIVSEREIYEDEQVKFEFLIKKQTENSIYVYDFESFSELWGKSSIFNILNLLKKYQDSSLRLNFILIEKEIESFYSKGISFTHNQTGTEVAYNRNCISDNCHFGNIEEYPFDAYFFNLNQRPASNNKIVEVLDKLSLCYCLISFFDITSISEDTYIL